MRHCKTCLHLVRKEYEPGKFTYRCGYTVTITAPWPMFSHTFAPNYVIGSRHVVPGDHYLADVDGSTKDWTEVMDCPVYEP